MDCREQVDSLKISSPLPTWTIRSVVIILTHRWSAKMCTTWPYRTWWTTYWRSPPSALKGTILRLWLKTYCLWILTCVPNQSEGSLLMRPRRRRTKSPPQTNTKVKSIGIKILSQDRFTLRRVRGIQSLTRSSSDPRIQQRLRRAPLATMLTITGESSSRRSQVLTSPKTVGSLSFNKENGMLISHPGTSTPQSTW